MGAQITFLLRTDMEKRKASGQSPNRPDAFSSNPDQGNHCDDAE